MHLRLAENCDHLDSSNREFRAKQSGRCFAWARSEREKKISHLRGGDDTDDDLESFDIKDDDKDDDDEVLALYCIAPNCFSNLSVTASGTKPNFISKCTA